MDNLFDIRTLSIINSLTSIIITFLMLYIFKKHKTYCGFKLFVFASFLNSSGFILLGMRNIIPMLFTVIAANLFILTSWIILFHAVSLFCSVKHSKIPDIILLSIYLLLFIYYTYFDHNINARILVSSFSFFMINMKIFYFSFKDIKNSFNTAYMPIPLSAFILGIGHLIRVITTSTSNIIISDFMNAGIVSAVILMLFCCSTIAFYSGFIALNSFRSETELQQSLKKIKTLQGLLPICAYCRKIRDDSGYWNEIENYILKHSDVEFSHSLCPDCLKKYYSDIIDI